MGAAQIIDVLQAAKFCLSFGFDSFPLYRSHILSHTEIVSKRIVQDLIWIRQERLPRDKSRLTAPAISVHIAVHLVISLAELAGYLSIKMHVVHQHRYGGAKDSLFLNLFQTQRNHRAIIRSNSDTPDVCQYPILEIFGS